jgi:hypothetical protein
MASRYLQPAWITRHPPAERTRWLLAAVLAAISWCAIPVHAASAVQAQSDSATDAPLLVPYTAQYKTTARGIGMTVTRELQQTGDEFVLTNGGKIMVVGFHEVSVFSVEDARIVPESYFYRGTGMVKRRRELHFSPGAGKIDSLYKDEWYDLPYTETTLDRMNQLEQLRLILLDQDGDSRDISLRVADGKRVKESRLVLVAEETLETPMGPVDTLHYSRLHEAADRKSDIWVAPEWDYLMVRTLHVEDGDPVEMILTNATLDGVALSVD